MLSCILLHTLQKEEVKKKLSEFEFTINSVKEINNQPILLVDVMTDDLRTLKSFIADELKKIEGILNIKTLKIEFFPKSKKIIKLSSLKSEYSRIQIKDETLSGYTELKMENPINCA